MATERHRGRAEQAAAIEQRIDRIVVDYAAAYCLRAVQREQAIDDLAIAWTVDDHLMVVFRSDDRGGGDVRVHEIGLLAPLRKGLRSRRLRVTYVFGAPNSA
jgi:hypothetical protein